MTSFTASRLTGLASEAIPTSKIGLTAVLESESLEKKKKGMLLGYARKEASWLVMLPRRVRCVC